MQLYGTTVCSRRKSQPPTEKVVVRLFLLRAQSFAFNQAGRFLLQLINDIPLNQGLYPVLIAPYLCA